MAIPGNVWNQLKNLTAGELAKALERDGWSLDVKGGSQHIYWKDGKRVSIHVHPHKTYGPAMLKALLNDIGWTVDDYKRLKVVK